MKNFQLIIIIFLGNIIFQNCSESGGFNGKNGIKLVHFKGTDLIQQSIEYKNGKKNGILREFYKNGKLKALHKFIDDMPDDTSFFYYEDGKLAKYQIRHKNKRQGCWREFNKEGLLFSEICFKNDVLDSTSTEYTYRTGRLLTRVNYNLGVKHGKHEHYYSNGKPKSTMFYNNGDLCLGAKEWSDNGKEINRDFKILVSEHNELLMNNTLSFVVRLQDPQPDDKVYQVMASDTGNVVRCISSLPKRGDAFVLELNIHKGGFVMETIKLAAYRKIGRDLTIIRTTAFKASANNF